MKLESVVIRRLSGTVGQIKSEIVSAFVSHTLETTKIKQSTCHVLFNRLVNTFTMPLVLVSLLTIVHQYNIIIVILY